MSLMINKHDINPATGGLSPLGWAKLAAMGSIALITLGVSILFLYDVGNTANDYANEANATATVSVDSKQQFRKKYDEVIQAQIDKSKSGNNKGSKGSGNITGDWDTDSVDGYKVSWIYLCSIYEGGTLNPAALQGHYDCACAAGTPNVPSGYGQSSVAHGPFQADSKYTLTAFLTSLVQQGYSDLQPYILSDGDRTYLTYDSRNSIHQVLIKYREDDFIGLLTAEMKAMMSQFLSEAQIAALEASTGKTRDEIHPAILSAMYSINIYCGSSTCKTTVSSFTPDMTNEEMLRALYERRRQKKNGDYPRVDNELQTALNWAANPDFDGYESNDVVGKGSVSFGKQMGLEGY